MVKYANVEEQYSKCKDLKKEDVKMIKDWLAVQPHYPPITELQIIIFFNSCYYSNEATKICIDNYYTARTLCPEFFANRNPSSTELKNLIKSCGVIAMPKLTLEGYTIFYGRLVDSNPEHFIFNSALKYFDMIESLHLQEMGALNGHIIIIDLQGCTIAHIMKIGIMSVKKFMFFLQEALPFRIKGFHFVNAVPFMDKILALMKPFMKKELADMIQIHLSPNDTIYKSIPKDCLPSEIGGNCSSFGEMNVFWQRKLVDNTEYFLEEEKWLVDESKRPGKPKNAGDLFGVEGTFKKLDID